VMDPSPTPATYTGKWFTNAEQLKAFKETGALLVTGRKA
jgi:hypothetical protein